MFEDAYDGIYTLGPFKKFKDALSINTYRKLVSVNFMPIYKCTSIKLHLISNFFVNYVYLGSCFVD